MVEPILHGSQPWLTFWPPVFLAAWFAGWRAGAATLVISMVAVFAWLVPQSQYGMTRALTGAVVFAICGLAFCAVAQIANRRGREERWLRDGYLAFARAMSNTKTPTEVAQALVEQGGAILGADVAAFARLVDGDKMELLAGIRLPPEQRPASILPLTGPLGYVLRTGESCFAETAHDVRAQFPAIATLDRANQAVAGLPLRMGDRSRCMPSTKTYTAEDLLIAEQIGERAGAAITNAQLYRSARDAISARDEFMLVAGHELRTPTAALLLHHESLKATKEGTPLEKVRERGVKLHAQTERLARLVEDLLDVSRLSAGRLTLEPEEVDLGALTNHIVERMHDDIERASSPITTQVESVVGTWDKARIDQVITNLLTNALKYGRGAPIDVRVSRDGESAKLEVFDRGIGIAAGDQSRIFKRFERAVSPRKFGGLGLGLWIASQLVDAHHGTIGVASTPGNGATFTVTLPLTRP